MLAPSLLQRLSADARLPPSSQHALARTARSGQNSLGATRAADLSAGSKTLVFDCGGTETLPGSQVDIAHSVDDCVQRVAAATAKLVVFFKQVFGRNSIDNKGCPSLRPTG